MTDTRKPLVYVLCSYSEQSSWIKGVYSTLEQAKAADKGRKWKESDPGKVWTSGDEIDGVFIELWELD